MRLFLGVCKALKAMHQYRVRDGTKGVDGQNRAKRVRGDAARADNEAADEVAASGTKSRKAKGRAREGDDDADTEQEPLMEGEVSMAQEGVEEGEIRAYAHRDIKPGLFILHY